METTTIELVQTRDLLDIFVAAFTILTGIAIALLAFLAFALQVTRYLKDSEPDLRFGNNDPDVQIQDSPELSFRLSQVDIDNLSAHDAINLGWDFVSLSGPAEKPETVEIDGIGYDWQGEESWPLEEDNSAPRVVLRRSSNPVTLTFRTGRAPINGEYRLRIVLGYSARRGISLRLIRLGHQRFGRVAVLSWSMQAGELLPGTIRWVHD